MVRNALDPDRLESAGTDVQCDVRKLDAACSQASQQIVAEMKAGSRRRDRAGLRRVNGLIAQNINRIGRMIDIRRQRHLAVLLKYGVHVAVEAQHEEIVLSSFDGRVHRISEYQRALRAPAYDWYAPSRVRASVQARARSALRLCRRLACARAGVR